MILYATIVRLSNVYEMRIKKEGGLNQQHVFLLKNVDFHIKHMWYLLQKLNFPWYFTNTKIIVKLRLDK